MMRRVLVFVAVAALFAQNRGAQTESPIALLVVGDTKLATADEALRERLKSLDYEVTAVTSVAEDDLKEVDLVFVSASASKDAFAAGVPDAAVPFVVAQPALLPEFGMTGPIEGVDFGTATKRQELAILNPDHPLAAKLDGNAKIASAPVSFGWGLPDSNAIVPVGIAEDVNLAAVFAYEQGVAMLDRGAAARRVALFPGQDAPPLLTDDGWALFDAAVRWAATRNEPPHVDAGADFVAENGDDVLLNGVVEDDGLPERDEGLDIEWNVLSGPGAVEFDNAASPQALATFHAAGTYALRLFANDGLIEAADDIVVVVNSPASGGGGGSGEEGGGSGGGGGPESLLGGPTALLIAKGGTLSSGENDLKTRLQNLGFTVTTIPDQDVNGQTGNGWDLVVVSNIATQGSLGGNLVNVNSPLLNMLQTWLPVLQMTGSVLNTDYGTQNGTQVAITAAGHPLAAGLTGTVTVVSGGNRQFVWGKPNASATKAATIVGNSNRATSFGYESGATMFSSFVAPNRRVGLFPSDNAADNLSVDGGKLFDAAATWAANEAPIVSAGNDLAILGQTANLDGTVTDDGFPTLPMILTTTWSKTSGPCTLSFGNASQVDTTVAVVGPNCVGTHILRLTATDGNKTTWDEVQVIFANQNNPPSVSAGPDLTEILRGSPANLDGTVIDDGIGTLTRTWTKVSGPGIVTFGNASAEDTTATFSLRGTYVLRLTANDGSGPVFDEMTAYVEGSALLVVGDTSLSVGDGVYMAALEERGFIVTIKDGVSVVTGDATGRDVVLITSTVTSGDVNTKFRTINVPTIVAEEALYDDMSMTGTGTSGHSTTADQTKIVISEPMHPIAAGLRDLVSVATVKSLFGWGVPSASAVKIATLETNPAAATIFAYESGAAMLGLNAPARRVGFFARDAAAEAITPAGRALLGAAIDWSVAENLPPVVYAGTNLVVNISSGASLTGQAVDDALPNPPGTLTKQWTQVGGPGTASFTAPTSLSTGVTFSVPGSYSLRLTVSDSVFGVSDDVDVSVGAAGVNQVPLVNAGFDRSVVLPLLLTITGSATDDGLPVPPGALSPTWSKMRGPGSVGFGTPSAFSTTVTFGEPGAYVLRLSVADGSGSSGSDDVSVAALGDALLVVQDSGVIDTGEAVLKARLEALGYAVTLINGSLPAPAGVNSMAIVVIAPDAVDAGGKYSAKTIPVITMYQSIFDDNNLTQSGGAYLGVAADQDSVAIAAPSHPMAAGFAGVVRVSGGPGTFSWGVPAGTAQVVATLENDSGKAVIFAYEEGAAMVNLTAPDRRVAFGLNESPLTDLTSSGAALFDQAVRWATRSNLAPVVDAGPDINATVGQIPDPVMSGTVTDDNLPIGSLSIAWEVLSQPTGSNVEFRPALSAGP